MQEQRAIAAKERRFGRDGRLSKNEKQRLNRMQNQASRSIYAEKHDRQSRWWNPWDGYSRKRHAYYGPQSTLPSLVLALLVGPLRGSALLAPTEN